MAENRYKFINYFVGGQMFHPKCMEKFKHYPDWEWGENNHQKLQPLLCNVVLGSLIMEMLLIFFLIFQIKK